MDIIIENAKAELNRYTIIINDIYVEINKILHLEYEKFVIHSLNCFKVLYLFLQISWKINSREKKKLHLGKIDLRCFWISFQTLSECSIYFLRLENVLKVLDFLFKLSFHKLRKNLLRMRASCLKNKSKMWDAHLRLTSSLFFFETKYKNLENFKNKREVCTKRCNPSFKKKLKYASFAIYIKRVICLKVMKIICI